MIKKIQIAAAWIIMVGGFIWIVWLYTGMALMNIFILPVPMVPLPIQHL